MPGTFPPELVHRVVDELGEEYHESGCLARGYAYEVLRTCALVSKRWTFHSRKHIFKKVRIDPDKHNSAVAPPASILPCIKELEIFYAYTPTQGTSIADVLKTFVAAPVERLRITGIVLFEATAHIQEFIEAHSATLQTVELQSCSLSASGVVAVLLGRRHLKILRFIDCHCKDLPLPEQPPIADTPDPKTCSKAVGLELSITEGDPWEGPADVITMIAQLPYRFSRLDIDHLVAGEGTTEATNALIKANADVLSSLQVHFIAEDMEVDVEPEFLFNLKDCSNLSELTLDMEHSESCAVQDSIFILSTLNPERMNHLGKIVLKYIYVDRWFDEEGQLASEDEAKDWEGLDALLARLANTSITARERRLEFTLVVLISDGNGRKMSMVRRWLPKVLPRFNELGLLHVHRHRGNRCRTVDDSRLHHDKPECLNEDFRDGS